MQFINVHNDFVPTGIDYNSEDFVKVVDYSGFMPDAEQVRAFKFNPQGTGSNVVYDYPDGKVPKHDTVSSELVSLRSGKLDKADIPRLKDKILKDAAASDDKSHSKRVSDAVDKLLGVPGNNPTEK